MDIYIYTTLYVCIYTYIYLFTHIYIRYIYILKYRIIFFVLFYRPLRSAHRVQHAESKVAIFPVSSTRHHVYSASRNSATDSPLRHRLFINQHNHRTCRSARATGDSSMVVYRSAPPSAKWVAMWVTVFCKASPNKPHHRLSNINAIFIYIYIMYICHARHQPHGTWRQIRLQTTLCWHE